MSNGVQKNNGLDLAKNEDQCIKKADIKAPDKFLGVRHLQTALFFNLTWIAYTMRTVLSVAIVAMTDSTASSNPDIPTYDWGNKNVVLSSFYWGYICSQLISGQLSRWYGPKWFLVAATLFNSGACMLIPVMADNLGSGGVMACRIVQGLAQGFTYPCLYTLLSKWAPPGERSRIGAFVFSGSPFGTIITMPLTGLISSSWVGWPVSFYTFGSLGLIWTVFWIFLGSNSPAEHKSISEEEKVYIETSLDSKETKHYKTPWKHILTSLPVWAILVADMGFNWGYSTLINEIPTYMNKIMGFDMKSNGFLSALPYLVFWFVCILSGHIQDFLINRGYLSRTRSRKLFNTIAMYIPAAALLWLAFIPGEQIILSVVLLVIAVGVSATAFSGFLINHLDLSPNFAGTLMGIVNGTSHIFAMMAPLAVHAIVYDEEDKSLWKTIFIVSAVIDVIVGTLYLMFASGDIQVWNYVETESNEEIAKASPSADQLNGSVETVEEKSKL